MKLDCSNVGKIEKASIEVNSITLIAGLNNTGKSTISKTLYCIFNSFYNVKNKSEDVLKTNINSVFKMSSLDLLFGYSRGNQKQIKATIKELLNNRESVTENIITNIIKKNLDSDFIRNNDIDISRLFSILTLSQEDINKKILQNLFTSEFQGQIQNFNSKKETSINLQIKDKIVKIIIKDNIITELENLLNLTHEARQEHEDFIRVGERRNSVF